ncbi:MAG: LysR family transcriptional regulator [Clostridiales Family XIII bacterium]|jgi:DNA-binding transcriptional LysR family regulator|nr:LysR family transcriptional regulator [Clostridiales Family XIII bacterium]
MNTSQIECFLAASEHLSFTKAAESLHLAQPTLSRQIITLEREIGVRLFARKNNTVRLTAAGAILAAGLSVLRGDLSNLIKRAQRADREERDRQVTLNIGTAMGQRFTGPITDSFLAFSREQPNIQIQITYFNLSRLIPAFVEDEVDACIVSLDDIGHIKNMNADLDYLVVREGRGCVVLPADHPLASKTDLKLADLTGETFLIVDSHESGMIARKQLELCEAFGMIPSKQVTSNIGTLAMWLETGVGISTMNPWHMLKNSPNLKFIEIDELEPVREVFAWKKSNVNPGIPALVKAFHSCPSKTEAPKAPVNS